MTLTAPAPPLPGTVLLAGCSRRKAAASCPLPALELYTGGIAPQLRARFGRHPQLRQRIFFLSARHGLVAADNRLSPYDEPLTPAQADALRPVVHRTLRWQLAELGTRPQLLVVAEPLYLVLLADLLSGPDRPPVRWIPDPRGWEQTATVLTEWNWL